MQVGDNPKVFSGSCWAKDLDFWVSVMSCSCIGGIVLLASTETQNQGDQVLLD